MPMTRDEYDTILQSLHDKHGERICRVAALWAMLNSLVEQMPHPTKADEIAARLELRLAFYARGRELGVEPLKMHKVMSDVQRANDTMTMLMSLPD